MASWTLVKQTTGVARRSVDGPDQLLLIQLAAVATYFRHLRLPPDKKQPTSHGQTSSRTLSAER